MARYDAIGNTEYETVRLRRLLTGRKPMTELDAELLQSAVSKARVTSNCVTVTLKNGRGTSAPHCVLDGKKRNDWNRSKHRHGEILLSTSKRFPAILVKKK